MKRTDTNKTSQLHRRLMTIQEVSAYTGFSVETLYKMVNQKRIPFYKVDRNVRFDLQLLEEWLKKKIVMPNPTKKII